MPAHANPPLHHISDLPSLRAALEQTSDRGALLDALHSHWILSGDRHGLTTLSNALAAEEVIAPERSQLNAAWAALACGDVIYADHLLPDRIPDLGDREWNYAAEGALLRALITYGRGDLERARIHVGLAQAGLSGPLRDALLPATLLFQSRMALHQWNVDGAGAARQRMIARPIDQGECWAAAIDAIAAASTGDYDDALGAADRAFALAGGAGVGPHLFPHCASVITAMIHRDRGDVARSRAALEMAAASLDRYPSLPLHVEVLALKAHLELDHPTGAMAETLAALVALGTHPLASPDLQDLIDMREAELRIRTNELTRARVLIDRLPQTIQRSFLEACADAEVRPSVAHLP